MKRMLYLISIACMVLVISSRAAAAAVPYTIYPYVPPTNAKLWEQVFNASGITAAELPESDKAGAYVQLVRDAMGVTAEATQDLINSMFDNARVTGKLTIARDLWTAIQSVETYAITNGVKYGRAYPTQTSVAEWQMRLELDGVHITQERLSQLRNDYMTATAGRWGEAYLTWLICENGGTIVMKALSVSNTGYAPYKKQVDNYGRTGWYTEGWKSGAINIFDFDYATGQVGALRQSLWGGGSFYLNDARCRAGDTWQTSGQTATVQAQTGVTAKVQAGELEIITPYTEVVNGEIDDTKPIVITLPNTAVYPANEVVDLPAVQDELQAKPYIDGDAQAQVDAIQQAYAEKYGDIQEYSINLTNVFPFCLPFDIARIIAKLEAEPMAPAFAYTFEAFGEEITLEIDMSIFDGVAEVLRTLEIISFVIGLCVVTRSMYLRG